MDHPTIGVEFDETAPKALRGQSVRVHGFGTYRGTNERGFTTWHDGKKHREPKVTARLCFDSVTVNGIKYEGYQEIERAAMNMGDPAETPHAIRKGDWRISHGYGPRRHGGGDPTDTAREVFQVGALWAARYVDRTYPEFFAVLAERYALGDEIERESRQMGKLHDEINERAARVVKLCEELAELNRKALVSSAAEAVESIDADELERGVQS